MRSREIKRRAGIKKKRRGSLTLVSMRKFFSNLRIPLFSRRLGFSRKNREKIFSEIFFRACVLGVIFLLIFGGLSLFRPGIRVRVDAETVAAFRVPHRAIGLLRAYAEQNEIHFPKLFAVFNAENDFFPEKHAAFDLSALESLYVSDFNRLLRRYNSRSLAPYVTMFENLFSEIEIFPIPPEYGEIMFGDSWGVGHNFQNRPMHMGTAIIDRENIRGRVSVVSMTRGTVRDAGWDNQLGYFVGVVTENGTYYLYAHLESLAAGLAAGQEIPAGTPLGKMGNTGGGRDTRSFPVHLHIAISPEVSFTRGEFWINPYPLLRYIKNG